MSALASLSSILIPLSYFVAVVACAALLGRWAIQDAKLRGKSPWLVAGAVLLFFPWGLIAWLVFRPDSAPRKAHFRLEDYRVQ